MTQCPADIELLSCPFCGHAGGVIEDNSYGACIVGCGNALCEAQPHILMDATLDGLAMAAKAWNSRVVSEIDIQA